MQHEPNMESYIITYSLFGSKADAINVLSLLALKATVLCECHRWLNLTKTRQMLYWHIEELLLVAHHDSIEVFFF